MRRGLTHGSFGGGLFGNRGHVDGWLNTIGVHLRVYVRVMVFL